MRAGKKIEVEAALERFKERGAETSALRGEIIQGANADEISQLRRKPSSRSTPKQGGNGNRIPTAQDGGGDQIGTTTESLDLNREQAGQTEKPRPLGTLPAPGGS
jgi:hypothetical protein